MQNSVRLVLLLIFPLLSGCIIIREMLPKNPTSSVPVSRIAVIPKEQIVPIEEILEDSFYVEGANEPHTPPNITPRKPLFDFLTETQGSINLNQSRIFRFRNIHNKADKIIILCTGIYSGAGTVVNLARAVAAREPQTEVWVWERRSSALEDRRLLKKAVTEKNTSLITRHLKKGRFELKEKPFYQPTTEDIPFAGYWGLNVQLEDLYRVVQKARSETIEVILAGYSMGVLYVSAFLANDFLLNGKNEPGYTLVTRAMFLDGPPVLEGYVPTEAMYRNGSPIFPPNYVEGIDKLESGNYYPCNGTADRDFSFFFLMDARAILAHLDPDGLFPEPFRTADQELPVTNKAAYLLGLDSDYQMYKLFTASFGKADALHSGNFGYFRTVNITGLSPGNKAIGWIDRKEGDPGEYNDPDDYIRTAVHPDYNFAEWYQPTRTLLDIGSIRHNDTRTGWQKKYFRLFHHQEINIPVLAVGLSRGLVQRIEPYQKFRDTCRSDDFTIIMLNDFTHLDGDTVTDRTSRQYMADIISRWITDKAILTDK